MLWLLHCRYFKLYPSSRWNYFCNNGYSRCLFWDGPILKWLHKAVIKIQMKENSAELLYSSDPFILVSLPFKYQHLYLYWFYNECTWEEEIADFFLLCHVHCCFSCLSEVQCPTEHIKKRKMNGSGISFSYSITIIQLLSQGTRCN